MFKRKYERNLPALVTFHTLISLYINFSDGYPKEISDKIEDLLKSLADYSDKDYPKDHEIVSTKLYEVIEFRGDRCNLKESN